MGTLNVTGSLIFVKYFMWRKNTRKPVKWTKLDVIGARCHRILVVSFLRRRVRQPIRVSRFWLATPTSVLIRSLVSTFHRISTTLPYICILSRSFCTSEPDGWAIWQRHIFDGNKMVWTSSHTFPVETDMPGMQILFCLYSRYCWRLTIE